MALFSRFKLGCNEKNVFLPQRGEENEILVYSPLIGELVPLSHLSDKVFREEILGKTFAIEPSVGKLYSPVDGTITAIYSSLHAICLVSDSGLQMLIHIGEDTVRLNGKYFLAKVEENQHVLAGQLLLEFDINSIVEAGYSTTTCLIIVEPELFKSILLEKEHKISAKEKLIRVYERSL